jgi:hypothetical protein
VPLMPKLVRWPSSATTYESLLPLFLTNVLACTLRLDRGDAALCA